MQVPIWYFTHPSKIHKGRICGPAIVNGSDCFSDCRFRLSRDEVIECFAQARVQQAVVWSKRNKSASLVFESLLSLRNSARF